MPFREVSIVEQRREFIAFAVKDGANIRELCRRFGISRQTAYKWLERYRREGLAGLNERSRRPKTSPLSRSEQLRLAKRAQRARERDAGTVVVPLKLSARDAERVRAAIAWPEFAVRLRGLLDDALIDIAGYENLSTLCWNRRDRYLAAEEAFRLYERNWRFVDMRRMKPTERALIERLAARYGNGVLNV